MFHSFLDNFCIKFYDIKYYNIIVVIYGDSPPVSYYEALNLCTSICDYI
jgi:hypothetical protein